MANYVASNANRFYVALEATYGQASIPVAANRFPAVKLQAGQVLETSKRLDKTGTRTFLGTPKDARRRTAYEVRSYLTSWSGTGQPSYGPLFQAALGAAPAAEQRIGRGVGGQPDPIPDDESRMDCRLAPVWRSATNYGLSRTVPDARQ